MDDDDVCSGGLSDAAWYELGRQAEQSDQVQAQAVAVFAARLRGERPMDVGGLLASNEALWQQSQQLWQQNQIQQQRIHDLQVEIQERWEDLCNMRGWAHSEIDRLKSENAALRDLLND